MIKAGGLDPQLEHLNCAVLPEINAFFAFSSSIEAGFTVFIRLDSVNFNEQKKFKRLTEK